MSTKIPHGYQLPSFKTKELFAWMRRLQTRFEKDVPERVRDAICAEATGTLDQFHTDRLFRIRRSNKATNEWTCPTALQLAFQKIQEALKESDRKCLRDDFILEVTILEAGGQLLGLLHNNSRFVEAWFKKHGGVKPLPFWNNTDAPPQISQREWNQRGRLWDKALRGRPPISAGLALRSEDPEIYVWQVREKPPQPATKETRARHQAKNILWNISLRHEAEITGSKIMEVAQEIATHPGVEQLARHIAPHLPDIRRWEDLEVTVPTTYK